MINLFLHQLIMMLAAKKSINMKGNGLQQFPFIRFVESFAIFYFTTQAPTLSYFTFPNHYLVAVAVILFFQVKKGEESKVKFN